MNIGQIANQTGLTAKTIRYYEAQDLLSDVARTDAGYRVYNLTHIRQLKFIRHCRGLGFSYSDIHDLLALWQQQNRHSRDVKQLAEKHIQTLQHKVFELERMIGILQRSVDECAGNTHAECSILNQLENFQASSCDVNE